MSGSPKASYDLVLLSEFPLTAAQAQTLTQLWVWKDAGWNYANPIVANGTVYITAGEGQVHAIDCVNVPDRALHDARGHGEPLLQPPQRNQRLRRRPFRAWLLAGR